MIYRFNSALFWPSAITLLLFVLSIGAQTPQKPTKEEKKQAEQQRKEQEKHAKEEAKRREDEHKAKSRLEKQIPIGKTVEYDRFKDVTAVYTHGMIVYPLDRDMSFATAYVGIRAGYVISGQFGSSPATVRLIVSGQSLLVGTPSRPCSLSMILNGTSRVQLGELQYGTPTSYAYVAWVDMSLSSFRALSTASSIEMQTCQFETVLNPRHIAGLAVLLEGLPGANSGASVSQPAVGSLHPIVGTWKFQVIRGGVAEDWLLRIENEGTALRGSVTTATGEIVLTNMISAGNIFSASASELVPNGLNMIIFSGQVANNGMSGKIAIYLAGQQQPVVPFEAQRISSP
jgi:hypothetical protein